MANELPDIAKIEVKENTIFTPEIARYGFQNYHMNDQIAIGDMQSMKVYCSIYDHVYKYVFEDDIILHPETLLHHHLQKLNIEISLFSYIYGLDPNRK